MAMMLPGTLWLWRPTSPGNLMWTVVRVYAIGRFLAFFAARDVPVVGWGLRQAQWQSIALIVAAAIGIPQNVGRLTVRAPLRAP